MTDWLDADTATWPEAAGARDRLVLLPFGATEQHGPHLPLSTDTTMAAGLARRLAAHLGGLLLPAVPFGASAGNDGYAGTVSLAATTVRSIALDVCAAVGRHGHPGLVVVNGDFGNRRPLHAAVAEAASAGLPPVLVLDYPGLEEAAAAVLDTEPAAPNFYHADELETSIMLALRPDAVHMDRAAPEHPTFPADFASAPLPLHRLSRSGVFGDPRPASASKGERLLAALTAGALHEVDRWRAGLRPPA
jgi:creatinine amidohydrolase